MQKFSDKICAPREALNDRSVQTKAAELMDKLIDSVTIYTADGPAAEVVANVSPLGLVAI